jgi:SNF2 family DNA or RNA helicase
MIPSVRRVPKKNKAGAFLTPNPALVAIMAFLLPWGDGLLLWRPDRPAMNHSPSFIKDYLAEAQKLLKAGAVGEPLFSRGTYQYEVVDSGKKKAFPFLQMNDEGLLSDFFCSCKVSEAGKGCPHLAASYLQVFNGKDEPLHVRYRKSLWSRLFQIANARYGDRSDCLKKEKEGVYSSKEPGFFIEASSPAVRKKLVSIFEERPVETEETSLKFSNLSSEEMAQYRAGNLSHFLRFELSFWSDLAKWLMHMQEVGSKYEVLFEQKEQALPHKIILKFPALIISFELTEANWPWLIPALSSVHGPLQVFDSKEETIEAILYDENKEALLIQHKGDRKEKERTLSGIIIGDWTFVEGKGFYRNKQDPLLNQHIITKEHIAEALNNSTQILQAYLPVFPEKRPCRYHLYFDAEENFHIELYIFEPKDMSSPKAKCYSPWAYLPGKGFYHLEEWLFEGKEKIIPKNDIADFINNHRLWLQNFPGFQIHLRSLESHLTYRIDQEGNLRFEAELNVPEENAHHFDEWVYIDHRGFFMKKEASRRLPIHPGLIVPKEEVSHFIQTHKEDLEQVQNFYNPISPIQKIGLNIKINEENKITLTPQIDYAPGITAKDIRRFGDYVYVEGKGFSDLMKEGKFPERYQQTTTIEPAQEASFLTFDLERLKPYILNMDTRLLRPESLKLNIRKIVPTRKKRGRQWFFDFIYTSSLGSVDIFSIWNAFQNKKRYLFSPAGLLDLKEPRFNWIRQLPKKRIDEKRSLIKLNTMEWIRLSIFEQVQPPQDPQMKKLFLELNSTESSRLLDISKLKATLRPYQETGLHWLWFLYCHGLSGLLCDDMGLGKTHQAMALLAAICNEDEERANKYLVVCPTSVIYHWQELLKRFLPEIRVCIYYGIDRSLDDFEEKYDLILTSYGILRAGKNVLKAHRFEVAIFDEIQIAKNHASQTHKALRTINAQMKLGLTGTPIENRIRELKSLIDIVLPSYMPPDPIFREQFINPIEKEQDEKQKELLGKLVKPFILRRKKSEVLTDLPEKIEEIAYCDLSDEQKTLYKQVAFQLKDTLYQDLKDTSKPVSFVHIFSALSTLKQICDHPALFLKEVKNYRRHQSGKWELFEELLTEARDSGQKVVVFSQYLEMLAIIESYLKQKKIGFASIKGSTRDRAEQLKKFKEDPKCEVFLASLLAAGVGIDLTVASIVIHYDRWWNPAKENQATDRVHRIGQNRGVQVFKLVTKNTIEEHIHEMIERKKGLLEDIIGQEDQINYLSREDLLRVFEKMFTDY